ncbi:hypothetical protein [Janthinobacterium sp. LM6]|uniref:hypothetical protein n=1 Tax=Janthinobacterium sp. LM6 TaxID=1938606 RepID=UPI0012373269|nr:hypothetical protein [Janthinobacterium sp. LM6]
MEIIIHQIKSISTNILILMILFGFLLQSASGFDDAVSVSCRHSRSASARFSTATHAGAQKKFVSIWIYLLYLVNLCSKMQLRPDQQACRPFKPAGQAGNRNRGEGHAYEQDDKRQG